MFNSIDESLSGEIPNVDAAIVATQGVECPPNEDPGVSTPTPATSVVNNEKELDIDSLTKSLTAILNEEAEKVPNWGVKTEFEVKLLIRKFENCISTINDLRKSNSDMKQELEKAKAQIQEFDFVPPEAVKFKIESNWDMCRKIKELMSRLNDGISRCNTANEEMKQLLTKLHYIFHDLHENDHWNNWMKDLAAQFQTELEKGKFLKVELKSAQNEIKTSITSAIGATAMENKEKVREWKVEAESLLKLMIHKLANYISTKSYLIKSNSDITQELMKLKAQIQEFDLVTREDTKIKIEINWDICCKIQELMSRLNDVNLRGNIANEEKAQWTDKLRFILHDLKKYGNSEKTINDSFVEFNDLLKANVELDQEDYNMQQKRFAGPMDEFLYLMEELTDEFEDELANGEMFLQYDLISAQDKIKSSITSAIGIGTGN